MQEEEIFNDILNQYRDKIYRVCYGYLYDKSLVNDLFQEVLINIWNSLSSFRNEAQISTWMYRIAVNTAITFNKKEKKHKNMYGGEVPENYPHLDNQKEEKLQTESEITSLHNCLLVLEKNERIIIGLLLEDLSYKEIADIAGISTNLVGVKINRIKKKLSKLLKKDVDGAGNI